ncbi:MAG: hypothetical protein L6407_09010 [Candidatus Delongbacteria bacterium]|nr:hypothetical protein [Candidatus Delongbacteria bacterium]
MNFLAELMIGYGFLNKYKEFIFILLSSLVLLITNECDFYVYILTSVIVFGGWISKYSNSELRVVLFGYNLILLFCFSNNIHYITGLEWMIIPAIILLFYIIYFNLKKYGVYSFVDFWFEDIVLAYIIINSLMLIYTEISTNIYFLFLGSVGLLGLILKFIKHKQVNILTKSLNILFKIFILFLYVFLVLKINSESISFLRSISSYIIVPITYLKMLLINAPGVYLFLKKSTYSDKYIFFIGWSYLIFVAGYLSSILYLIFNLIANEQSDNLLINARIGFVIGIGFGVLFFSLLYKKIAKNLQ